MSSAHRIARARWPTERPASRSGFGRDRALGQQALDLVVGEAVLAQDLAGVLAPKTYASGTAKWAKKHLGGGLVPNECAVTPGDSSSGARLRSNYVWCTLIDWFTA